MANVVVALSPFFGGKEGFLDEVSGIHFNFGQRGELVPYDISRVKDLSGIKRAIRLNVLLLVEGSLDDVEEDVTVVEEPKAEEPAPAPVKEVVIEVPAEEVAVEEVKVEAKPKKRK